MEKGNIRSSTEVSFCELVEIAQEKGTIRVGATRDLDNRIKHYEGEGYSGELFYAKTTNMYFAENKLLELLIKIKVNFI